MVSFGTMARPVSSIEQALEAALPRASKLLLAVSGGVDSTALLHACCSHAKRWGQELGAAHVDHGLRPTSGSDASFVEQACMSLGVPLFKIRLTPPESGNIEAWARAERYRFFGEVLRKEGFDWIVTAHHADDSAETLVMRLVSNKEPGEISACDIRRRLLRPLLKMPRSAIDSYAQQLGLRWVEDETNQSHDLLRNRVRHRVLPLLREEFDPRIVETLAARAEALADDASALDAWSRSEASRVSEFVFGTREWLQAVTAILAALEPAVQWRFVRDLLLSSLGYPLGRAHGYRVVHFLLSGETGVQLAEGVSLRRQGGGVAIARP